MYILDRFEEDYAVFEALKGKETVNVKRSLISSELKEGDVVSYIGGKYIFDENETKRRKERLSKTFNSLWN